MYKRQPISDTTILSSTGAGCNHINHVSSQIPYTLVVAVCCFIGYLIAGFTNNMWLTLGSSIVLLIIALVFLHKRTSKQEIKLKDNTTVNK